MNAIKYKILTLLSMLLLTAPAWSYWDEPYAYYTISEFDDQSKAFPVLIGAVRNVKEIHADFNPGVVSWKRGDLTVLMEYQYDRAGNLLVKAEKRIYNGRKENKPYNPVDIRTTYTWDNGLVSEFTQEFKNPKGAYETLATTRYSYTGDKCLNTVVVHKPGESPKKIDFQCVRVDGGLGGWRRERSDIFYLEYFDSQGRIVEVTRRDVRYVSSSSSVQINTTDNYEYYSSNEQNLIKVINRSGDYIHSIIWSPPDRSREAWRYDGERPITKRFVKLKTDSKGNWTEGAIFYDDGQQWEVDVGEGKIRRVITYW